MSPPAAAGSVASASADARGLGEPQERRPAISKQGGSPAQIEAFANRLTEACIKACKAQGTIGEAKAQVWMEGTYSFTKVGELDLDLEVKEELPTNLPVGGTIGVGMDREREKAGQGKLKVSYTVTVRTRGGAAE